MLVPKLLRDLLRCFYDGVKVDLRVPSGCIQVYSAFKASQNFDPLPYRAHLFENMPSYIPNRPLDIPPNPPLTPDKVIEVCPRKEGASRDCWYSGTNKVFKFFMSVLTSENKLDERVLCLADLDLEWRNHN
ncbi:hypothetical protein CRM22_008335 [Opisthorchis felineus]|uniref:Uncharacterized protein n=1 Tax=Opisthorchis felineus TaxID=147828 RepID=A0A4S2LJL2_OPIFE|nr:hypothetical protein CRM22_008335 [Opisthorchis felineus]